jgi:hypothetical protein
MLISDAGALVDVEKFGVAKYIREMRNFCWSHIFVEFGMKYLFSYLFDDDNYWTIGRRYAQICGYVHNKQPITVIALSKAWTVFARLKAGIVGSNPTRGIDVCVYSVFVLGSGLATGWSLVQGVLPNALD